MSNEKEIDENFKFAVEQINNSTARSTGGPTDDEKLRFYGLYKQATVGNCNTPQPGFFDQVGRAKWNAWNSRKGMSSDDAKCRYCDEYMKISAKYDK
jgi:diazepam-binding inhibitor (GABA receptor modulating acyl-CoA-binding protein)